MSKKSLDIMENFTDDYADPVEEIAVDIQSKFIKVIEDLNTEKIVP